MLLGVFRRPNLSQGEHPQTFRIAKGMAIETPDIWLQKVATQRHHSAGQVISYRSASAAVNKFCALTAADDAAVAAIAILEFRFFKIKKFF